MRGNCTLLAVFAIAALGACSGREPYRCASPAQCVAGGVAGTCEPSGFCSFPDGSCPGGRKYEDHAGDGLAGSCVDVEQPMPDAGPCGSLDQSCCSSEGAACVGNLECRAGTCSTCVQDVAFGRRFGCVLRHDGTVWCVGENMEGQIGFGLTSTTPILEYMQVRELATSVPITDATALAAGYEHACAVRAGGAVSCWGKNNFGQLGNGSMAPAAAAVAVVEAATNLPLANIVELGSGDEHTCGRSDSGAVWCWGRNDLGQLADGSTMAQVRAVPVLDAPMMPLAGAVALTSAADHNCIRKLDGATFCWGRNTQGELGDMSNMNRTRPVPVGMTKSVDAGSFAMTCRVNMDDTAACTGSTWRYRLGDGSASNTQGQPNHVLAPVPVLVSRGGAPLANVKQIVVGGVPCALLGDGTVRCWGDNTHGQNGTGATTPFPGAVVMADGAPLDRVERLVGHFSHLCAFREGGEIVCWGRNVQGELGNGNPEDVARATPVSFTCP